MKNVEIAEALFAAFASGDAEAARALCAPDLTASQNHGPAMNLDDLLKFSLAVLGVVEDFRYEDAVRTATESGFVEEHSVCGTLPDGSELKLAACVVAEVRDGRITSLREYLDGSRARGLLKALAQ
ncbi:MAG: nuclear transport factor 2 family protein [Pseudomonadales bacterium]